MKQKFAYLKQGSEFVVNHKIYTKIDERHAMDKYGTIVSFNTRDTVETDLSAAKSFTSKKKKSSDWEIKDNVSLFTTPIEMDSHKDAPDSTTPVSG